MSHHFYAYMVTKGDFKKNLKKAWEEWVEQHHINADNFYENVCLFLSNHTKLIIQMDILMKWTN